ncbi:hypothetical protein EVAR_77776_1 [Eumeta japonica]|uniref:Uncharacterized protein n=1 Tax=Eumeta variegata TaxID=151549 RepID=A0A4C1TB07_EUMVA|nr:hypothetical protein EVAR_77776_1 [Eumeta japonica]
MDKHPTYHYVPRDTAVRTALRTCHSDTLNRQPHSTCPCSGRARPRGKECSRTTKKNALISSFSLVRLYLSLSTSYGTFDCGSGTHLAVYYKGVGYEIPARGPRPPPAFTNDRFYVIYIRELRVYGPEQSDTHREATRDTAEVRSRRRKRRCECAERGPTTVPRDTEHVGCSSTALK